MGSIQDGGSAVSRDHKIAMTFLLHSGLALHLSSCHIPPQYNVVIIWPMRPIKLFRNTMLTILASSSIVGTGFAA